MKKVFFSSAVAMLILTGCSTSVANFAITTRDSELYQNENVTSSDYKNAHYVLETRGGGEIACVNIGQKDGARKGTKIDFFEINESMGKKYKVLVTEGRIFQVGDDSSWVKIKSYETADIRKKSFAQIATNQDYSVGEKLLWPPRFFKK